LKENLKFKNIIEDFFLKKKKNTLKSKKNKINYRIFLKKEEKRTH
jgi:hypothetical protein